MQASLWDPMLEVQRASKQLGRSSPEQQCERLALNEVMAEGASSTVYRGRWRNMDVAVKVRCGTKCEEWMCRLGGRR